VVSPVVLPERVFKELIPFIPLEAAASNGTMVLLTVHGCNFVLN